MLTTTPPVTTRPERMLVDRSPVRRALRYIVALTTAVSFQVAVAASMADQAAADCEAVVQAVAAGQQREAAGIDEREKLTTAAIENAKKCIDRVLATLRSMIPGMPSIGSIAIQQIIDYMSNRVCNIAINQINSTVGQVTGPINGAINQGVGQINGAISSGSNGAPLPQVSVGRPPVGGPSIWNKIGCTFGRGQDC